MPGILARYESAPEGRGSERSHEREWLSNPCRTSETMYLMYLLRLAEWSYRHELGVVGPGSQLAAGLRPANTAQKRGSSLERPTPRPNRSRAPAANCHC